MCGRNATSPPPPPVRLLSHPSTNSPGVIVAAPFEPLIIYWPFDASTTISLSDCVLPYGPTTRKGIHRRLALCAEMLGGREGGRSADVTERESERTRDSIRSTRPVSAAPGQLGLK